MYDELYVSNGYTFCKILDGLKRVKNSGFILLDKEKNVVHIRVKDYNNSTIVNLRLTDCKVKHSAVYNINLIKLFSISKVRSANNKEFEFSFGEKELTISKVVKEYDLIKSRTDKTLAFLKDSNDPAPSIDNLLILGYPVALVLDKNILNDFFDEFKCHGSWNDITYSTIEMQSFGEEMFFMSANVHEGSANFVLKKEQVHKLKNTSDTDQVSTYSLSDISFIKDILPAISREHRVECNLRTSHPFHVRINFPSIKGVLDMWVAPSTNQGYYAEFKEGDEIEYVDKHEEEV